MLSAITRKAQLNNELGTRSLHRWSRKFSLKGPRQNELNKSRTLHLDSSNFVTLQLCLLATRTSGADRCSSVWCWPRSRGPSVAYRD